MPRVLVIEDSPTQARQLAFILEDAGFEVVLAPDAESGFARLAENGFDLVGSASTCAALQTAVKRIVPLLDRISKPPGARMLGS